MCFRGNYKVCGCIKLKIRNSKQYYLGIDILWMKLWEEGVIKVTPEHDFAQCEKETCNSKQSNDFVLNYFSG